MSEQMELGLKIRHPFKPDANQKHPPLWIEEIRVYRSLSPDAEQCKYQLRPGMNILWADPGKGNAELYASGISGHAAGKTTFCRLLRYLLGEPEVGTKRFREHIAGWEPNAMLVGKVWLNGSSWIICRPLAVNDTEFVVKADNIESAFDARVERMEYDHFFQALENQGCSELLGRTLPSGDRKINWRRLLPWISRDQECRLSKLTVWRDPSTESHTPETTLADACYIIRCALKLVSEDEDRLHHEHRKITEDRKQHEIDVPFLQYQAKQGLMRLKDYVNDHAMEDDLLITACRKKLDADLAQLVETDEIKLQRARLQAAEEKLAESYEQRAVLSEKLREHKALLAVDKKSLETLRGDYKQEKAKQEMNDEDPAPAGRCNVPLRIAQREGCTLARGLRPDFDTHKNLMTLDEKLKAYQEQVQLMEADVADLEAQLTAAVSHINVMMSNRQKESDALYTLRSNLERRRDDVKRQQKELESVVSDRRESIAKEAKLEGLKKRERESLTKLNELRRKAETQKTLINGLFEDITRAVLGKEVSARFTDYSDRIDLDVQCRGDRESSATSTVQILAYDLAALLLGAEGEAIHPGLLIHDSPREADMAPDVYQRFFLYLKEIEKAYGDEEPNYQYIVTTTEPPPEGVLQKPWLIDRLDASNPKTRLLGVDLA